MTITEMKKILNFDKEVTGENNPETIRGALN
jgi:hypothetical protein